MKHYTSYYSNYKNIPKNYYCVGISRVCPNWFADRDLSNFVFYRNNFLAPSENLLAEFKANKISEDEYKKRYAKGLLEGMQAAGYSSIPDWVVALDNNYSEWEAVVFLCYESPDTFCHRQVLKRLLNLYNIQCDEYGVKENISKKTTAVELFDE